MNLPTGTITFLFTDIEGSTKLWEAYPEAMRLALERHDILLKAAIEAHNGYVFKTVGDAFCAAFPTAPDAMNAALEAHLALLEQEWGETGPLRVRMGLHTGAAQERGNDYFGPTLNRVARLQGIGHGQQTLLSQATYELVYAELPAEASLIDLGLHRLKDLTAPEHVWQLHHPSLPQEFAPLRSLNYLSTNLPQQLTSFIGREKEMQEIKELLQQTRLLTLTGSGGTGKTRLALQASAEVLEQYADGAWLVELAALSDPALVPQTVAEVLSIREAPGEPIIKTLASSLKDKQMLLVLDNCEHLLEASARLVDALLRSCPKVSVFASSREALGIGGESVYRVPSLSVPPVPSPHAGGSEGGKAPLDKGGQRGMIPESVGEYESVRLFMERAVVAKSDFTLTNQNASALASVCHRLDGIPLAIELAAARVRAMPLEQIESRLENRFRLLTGGSRTALPRQQTLKALIDWSYDLLNEPEKALLCRLSVFAGGWTLEAAECVCAEQERDRESGRQAEGETGRESPNPDPRTPIPDWEVLDLLTALVDKSLVVYEEKAGKARYRLLETVRAYARERLIETGEAEQMRQRHQDCFLDLAELAEPKLVGPEQGEWFERLEEEHENLRAALDWSLQEAAGASAGLRLCGTLSAFWWTRGHLTEGRQWCVKALGKVGVEERTQERAKALNSAGGLAWTQDDYASAQDYYEESLAIRREIGNRMAIASSLYNLGNVAYSQGNYASARAYYEESLTISGEIGDRRCVALSLNNLGNVARLQSDPASAQTYYEQSLAIRKEIEDSNGIAYALYNLGNVARMQNDPASAQAYYEESLAISREIGDSKGIADSLNDLGLVAYSQGNYAAAQAYCEESLTLFRAIGNRMGIASSLYSLGNVVYSQGDNASARAYYEESLAIRREIGDRIGSANSLNGLGNVAFSQGDASSRAYFEESLGIGREIGDRYGIAYSLNGLGLVAYSQGDNASARAYQEESLTLRREIGDRNGIASSLLCLGNVAYSQGNYAAAQAYCEESLTLCREIGDRHGVADSLEVFAGLAAKESRSEQSALLWGAAEALREEIGAALSPNEREQYDQDVSEVRQVLGVEKFSTAWAQGRAITMEQAIEFALEAEE